jgi:hypothetical protein
VVSVPARVDTPQRTYTVGRARCGVHEFIVFGFFPGRARPVLSDLTQRVLDGERLAINAGLWDVLPGMPAVMLDVPEVEAHHYLIAASSASRNRVGTMRASITHVKPASSGWRVINSRCRSLAW